MKKHKKFLCLFLALVMCLGLVNLSAFAAEGDTSEPPAGSESTSGPIDETEDEPTGETENEPTNETTDEPTNETGDEPAGETGDEPAGELTPAVEVDEEVQAFLDAVDEMTALAAEDDPDSDAYLAAMKKAAACYEVLTDEQRTELDADRTEEDGTYADMVALLKEQIETLEEPEEGGTNIFYVSDTGDDANAGTEAAPFKTLSHAVEKGNKLTEKDVTIVLLSDLTATKCARINGKDVIIQGNGHTITRGEPFETISDNARSWYNPAMIEVCDSPDSSVASLRLENITLDDGCLTAGTKYSQASTDGKGGNGDIVQDAIIATYDGVGTITLGENATLTGFGGMSAVRLSGGTLMMESGSKIVNSKVFGDKGGGTGAAGAVWIQGGTLDMQQGSEITGVNGRAIYIDGGSATVNGTISNITGNLNMWQGEGGAAIHVRNKGYAVLGETGVIENITGDHAGYRGAVTTNGSRGSDALNQWLEDGTGEVLWDFEAKPGSIIRNVTGFPTLYSNYGTELLDGTITGCSNDFIIGGFAQKTVIGANGVIEECTASRGAANAIGYTSNASKIYLQGKVQNNTASYAFYIINQSGGGARLDMYAGAQISGNSGTGVYINASGCTFYMHGGIITENGSYGANIREKGNSSATMIMDGGEITNNKSHGVYYNGIAGSGNTQGYIDLNGGNISGNASYQVYILGAYARDDKVCAHIAPGVVQAGNGEAATVYTSFGTLTLDANYDEIDLGNAKDAATNKIKDLVGDYLKEAGATDSPYATAGSSALWFRPTQSDLHFTVKSSSIKGLPLYAVYIPLNSDGTPVKDRQLNVKEITNGSELNVQLDDLIIDQPYALMWMQPVPKYGDIKVAKPTESVQEVLGQASYEVKNGVTYTMPKDIAALIKPGDVYTVTVTLDSRLSYDSKTASVTKGYSAVFDLGEVSYDPDTHTLTIQVTALKPYKYDSSVTLTIPTTMSGAVFDSDDPAPLTLDAKITGAVKLSEDEGEEPTNFECKIPALWETKLVPQPYQTVEYTGGSVSVKKGTALTAVTGPGGFAEGYGPPKTVEENIRISDPVREEYDFAGWDVTNNKETHTLALTARWARAAHDHQWGPWRRITDPSCTTPGLERRSCTIPDCSVTQDRAIDALGHNWGEWTVRTPATTTAPGEEFRACSRCGAEETRPIAQLPGGGGGYLPPSGGGGTGGGGVNIDDEEPPLANVDGLNDTDHFAYIMGRGNNCVQPEANITRAEAVTIFYRLMTEEYRAANWSTANSFTDADPNAWYNAALSTAAKAGIIQGYTDGTVKPNDPITRAEFAAIAARFMTDDITDEGVGDFEDTANMWASKEIRRAVKAGWIKGVGGNKFMPNNNITRAEVMALVNRMLDRVSDSQYLVSTVKIWTATKQWSDNPVTAWYHADVMEATNSHEYVRGEDGITEVWTALVEGPDWTAREKEWIANNGASAPASEQE